MSEHIGREIALNLLQRAERIEREKAGRALTPDEVRTLTAAAFLRKIAPYLVSTPSDPMLEIDGTAVPLEPGKSYLILVKRDAVSQLTMDRLAEAIKTELDVRAVILGVHDITDVRVIHVEAPECLTDP